MANNIYHKSNWGSPEKDSWGDVYFNPSATNKLYVRSDNYENSDGTDKALDSKPDTQSLLMTSTAYSVDSMNSVLPTNGDGDFTFARTSTATRVNKDGLIEEVATGKPRLDYPLIDGVVQDTPALLLEPSRTNNLPYSEEFDNSSWTKTNTSATANDIVSPDGNTTADKIVENSSTGEHRISDTLNLTNGSTYTYSVFAKKGERKFLRLRLENAGVGSGQINAFFDLENGSTPTSGASIINYGNGWYRCIASGTANTTSYVAKINVCDSISTISYTGDGTSGLYLWGVMLELGSYQTSYIKTTTASVTRSAETANSAGTSAEFNDSEGVLYAEIAALADDGTNRIFSISDGTTSNRVFVRFDDDSNQITAKTISGGTAIVDVSDTTTFNKIAFKYKYNDCALWINGIKEKQINTAGMPTGLSELAFDKGDGTADFYGKTKEVAVFKEALTDSELEALTSWDSFTEMAKGQEYTIR